jgi:hypothetical protein
LPVTPLPAVGIAPETTNGGHVEAHDPAHVLFVLVSVVR